jgi:hypothetical protein
MPADIGFNFPTGYSSPSHVFFPATGSRAHDDAGPQYLDEWGNYWTAAAVEFGGPYTHGKTLNFRFILNQEPTINVQFDRWKSCAYTVRPAVEETSVNISAGGMNGHDYDFNDGWQIN